MRQALLVRSVMVAAVGGAQEPVTGATDTDTSAAETVSAREIATLREEIVALRRQVDKLQTTIDVYINGMVAELQDENTRLRRLLRRTYGDEPEAIPAVPTPDRELVEDALTNPEPAALAPATEPPPPEPPKEFTHTVITEWGRSVEDATRLGEDVQSLKGMIVAVPPGSTDEQLREFARQIRAEYDVFDNINIEVFETVEAAEAFAAGNAAAGQDRVLSISKHAGSGRDVAVLIRKDRTEEIPLGSP